MLNLAFRQWLPGGSTRGRVTDLGWLALVGLSLVANSAPPAPPWRVGLPIVTYWCGPALTDTVAEQMKEGGFNLVWCGEQTLDVAGRHGLRGLLNDPLLTPSALDQPAERAKLDALVERVRQHRALYAYFITDEPSAAQFAALGRLVAYLRERDPAHLAYINLFPTYATNEQLGNRGDTVTAYREHLDQYVDRVKPALISYDHYQFTTRGDSAQYFLNLALIRQEAQSARLPFLNIVQASTWAPSMRVPTGDEVRYLVYTTLAYGAQGISYYVYCCPDHKGGIANADGSPTPLFGDLKVLNREFAVIAKELQPLASLGVYHAGMLPPGAQPLPPDARFQPDPAPPAVSYHPPEPVKGLVFGFFARGARTRDPAKATHVLVVNLDYTAPASIGLLCPGKAETFDAGTGKWTSARGKRVLLELPRGGGRLVRVRR